MQKFVKGFKHYPGVHCETSALRDVFAYHGIELSEPMLFGLGEGLGFIFWKSKQMKFPFVGGRNKNLCDILCKSLSIKKHDHFSASFVKAWNETRNLIDSDIPIFLKLDLYYLDYFRSKEHFGGHCIVLAGYDDKNVYLADTDFKAIQKTSLKNFELARSSKCKPFAPKNYYATFEFPKQLPDLSAAIKKSIKETAKNMLNPPIKNIGVSGIRKFGEEVLSFSNYDKSIFRHFNVWLEKAGTGGSCFRNLYRDFLKESLKYVDSESLEKGYEDYCIIAEKWKEIAEMLLEAEKKTELSQDIQKSVFEIYELEKDALQTLSKI